MKKKITVMMLMLLAVAVTAQAGNLVVNGDFAVYKPGTSIRGTCPEDIWVKQIGYNRPLSSATEVPFDDGTSGLVVDIPGWITPLDLGTGTTNNADLFSLGYADDGTSCANVFGAWSGQNGGLAKSENPIVVSSGTTYTLSAMFSGDPLPYVFGIMVDDVLLTPDAATDPPDVNGEWREITRTYNSIPAGDVRVLFGTPKPGEGDPSLTGSRLRIDNITLVPEPATMALLGLGGFLIRKRR